jgi:hypothetical protein
MTDTPTTERLAPVPSFPLACVWWLCGAWRYFRVGRCTGCGAWPLVFRRHDPDAGACEACWLESK